MDKKEPLEIVFTQFEVLEGEHKGKVFVGTLNAVLCYTVNTNLPQLFPTSIVKIIRDVKFKEIE